MQENKKNIAWFEIFLIVSLSVSFGWTIGSYYGTALEMGEVIEFFTLIPSVSAQQELGCGYSTSEGTCSVNTPEEVCDAEENCEFISGDPFCDDSRCGKGCCTIGLNTNWYTQSECQIQADREGSTSDFDSSVSDAAACFRQTNELLEGACVFPSDSFDNEKNDCSFTTQSNCDVGGGVFYVGKLCSNEELDTRCEKQDKASCSLSGDEVYWFDSCGNRENIYSSNRQGSWNNGNTLSKSESCGAGQDNTNSGSCGNCDYTLGSICGEFRPGTDRGNLEGSTCRDLNCVDEKGKSRIQGESWCVYDGPIGVGSIFSGRSGDSGGLLSGILGEFGLISTDLVGSRHFRRVCNNGEVDVEPCADYREEICVQNDKTLENGRSVDDAICRVNMWEQCLGYNRMGQCGPGCLAQCGGNPDCRIQPTVIDSNFRFTTCVPKYPPGFDLGSTSGVGGIAQSFASEALGDLGPLGDIAGGLANNLGSGTSAGGICGLASQTCTSTWIKTCGLSGIRWECVDNCNCHKESFTVQMNNLCVSLGDCGVYSNIEGKSTGLGANVRKKGKHGRTPLQPFFLIPVYSILAGVLGPSPPSGGFFKEESDILNLPLTILDPFLGGFNRVSSGSGGSQLGNMFGSGLGTTIGAGLTGALAGSAISVFTGAASAVTFGVTGSGALGAVTTAGVSGGAYGPIGGGTPIFGFDPLSIGIGIVVAIAITYALGCGKVDTVEIDFSCRPWTRPTGGSDCKKCDDDPLKPCSKYRCESLGSRCTLVNPGTGVQECIALEGEDTVPVITPWDDALNDTLFRYEDVSNNGFRIRTAGGECIPAYSYLSFGVNTDVFSQCYISQEPFEYDDRSSANTFLQGNLFTKNHSMVSSLPSVASLLASEVSSAEELTELLEAEVEGGVSAETYLLDRLGDWNLYVKCGNLDGIANSQEFRINFCVDAGPDKQDPVVLATAPPNENVTKAIATEQDAIFFVSEPAECRWDVISPITGSKLESYNSLANEMTCDTGFEDSICVSTTEGPMICGWACGTTLPITDIGNEFYVQCLDQPWLYGDVDNERNVGSVFDYTLFRTENELVIDSISPAGVTVAGSEPVIVELDVVTSSGAANGVAICEWGFDPDNYIDRFTDTDGVRHGYTLTQMIAGDYEVFIRCVDFVGNEALGSTTFTLELDTVAPSVTRVFGSSGTIQVITDEPSRCFYNESISGCGFTSENSLEFSGANTQILSTPLIEDIDYYIKCEDVWGNAPDSCSLVVRNYDSLGF